MTLKAISGSELDNLVKDSIPDDIPADHHFAVMAGVDNSGAKVVAVYHRESQTLDWKAEGAYQRLWNGDQKIGFNLMGSF